MAERKLNLNAPLWSVRRFSKPLGTSERENKKKAKSKSSVFEPTFKLEQVTKPVAVPFNWEQIPGKAKFNNDDKEAEEACVVTPTMPPPGKVSFNSGRVDDDDDGDDDGDGDGEDDVYSDALETFSFKDSASLNCSSENGYEGAFSTDPQTRDFMMKRFLPAAKAMALEPPHYAVKKQVEQPKEVVNTVVGLKRLIVPKYGDYREGDDEGSEDENNDYDTKTRSISTRGGCGLFPKLCFRNSLNILGPIPGLKLRTPKHSETKSVNKHTLDSTYKPKTNCGFRSAELHMIEKKKLVSESKRLTYSCDLQRGRSSPSTPSRATSISPYRNRPSQSPFRRAAFLGVPKEENYGNVKVPNIKPNYLYNKTTNKFEDITANHRNMNPAVEKTVYVDSVYNAESSESKSSCLDTKEQLNIPTSAEEEAVSESIFQDIQCLNSVGKQGDSELGLAQEFSEMVSRGNLSKESDQIAIDDSLFLPSPLPQPPLPKSPSESWLWRTAPSISLHSSFSRKKLNTNPKSNAKMLKSNTSLTNTKWETIVKSSHLTHDHARYSQELVAHISQKSNKY
ncbi:uncharacterized protein LOC115719548 isoform X2 [Cannabis sativa]|uniref:uncharacterized protein LOC115719548 isoform X2 n=1 Tax=Cannabis sativa TaxID=3483 RepID=UPI0029C9ED21|nr:uncharacterized protein LOC115719548 isoform X2 [Cannabis sativa]